MNDDDDDDDEVALSKSAYNFWKPVVDNASVTNKFTTTTTFDYLANSTSPLLLIYLFTCLLA